MARTQVLVIERDAAQHSFIVESLAGKFSTSSAYDENEGLEKSAQLQPVLVLLSGAMALKGSYVEKLRNVSNSINLPILVLISDKDRASKDRLLAGIAQEFLTMPFSKEELLLRVDNLLSLTRFRNSYQTVFNSMDQAFCIIEVIFDADNKPVDYLFLEVNSAFQQHTGFQDAVGKRVRELVPEHDQHWFDIYGKVAVSGESVRLEDRAEQMGRWFNVYAFRIGSPAERRVAVFFNDITEQKMAQQAQAGIVTVNEQLQAALEELQNLAYVMSHELQEPLQTIKSYQNLLAVRYRGRLGADADEFIAKCAAASDTTQKMVDDLWEYARVGQPSAFPIGKVDATRALSKAISTVHSRMIETDAEVDHGSLPAVMANENLMTALFTRLLDNALKYARPGVSPRIEMSVNEVGQFWEFEVRDNGKGIDPMIGKDIFKLFYRGERRVGQEGSGMGLPIARKIIEYFGGTISFESEPGLGTSFKFSIPKA